jgi:hypothetical protein
MIRRSVCILLLTLWCASASSQGLKLFSPEMKKVAPKPQVVVMDFLERYFHELSTVKQTTIQTKMADDKVFFRKVNPQTYIKSVTVHHSLSICLIAIMR